MKSILRRSLSSALAAIGGSILMLAAAPASAQLPVCNPGVTCLQFGDFNVYSLPLLELQRTGGTDGVPGPGSPYYFASGYGQIQQYTIIGINNGQDGAGNALPGVDGAYNTPSANNIPTFSTTTTADPGGAGEFTGDQATSWDIRLTALQTLVNAPPSPVVAFFAFNETGSGSGLDTTSLLAWARVDLCNDAGTVCQSFFLGGNTTPDLNNLPPANANPNNPAEYGPWVYVHAGICVQGTTFVGFPDANGACPVGSTVANQNNLGQNAAAFMINSPSLDAAIASGQFTVMNVTWMLAYINGGGETAWIQSFDSPTTVPEPASLALLAFALLALGVFRRRQS